MEISDVDLADLRRLEASLAGQGAQDVAAADLFLLAAEDLQGVHGGQQRLLGGRRHVGQRLPLQGIAQELLDAADAAHFVQAGQVQRQAVGARAAGAADAVQVALGVGRDVHVDHAFQFGDVQAARRHIGGHQHRTAAVGELDQHLVPLTLLQFAVQGQGNDALRLQDINQIPALLARIAKGQRARRAVVQEQLRDRMQA